MSQFLDPLDIEEITDDSDSLFKIIDHPFRYQSDLFGLITVPLNFPTDFESMPRYLPLLSDLLQHVTNEAACVHDWLYYSAITDRPTSDKILYEAMGVTGVPQIKRDLIYNGLILGGWKAWDDHRKAGHSAKDFETSNT